MRQTSQRCIGYLFNLATYCVVFYGWLAAKMRFAPLLLDKVATGCVRVSENNPWVALVYVIRKRSVPHPYSRLRWTADPTG